MNVTVGQIVEWILANRRGKAFIYEAEIIQREVCHAISEGVFVYSEVNGQIQGVACGRRNQREHVIHIYDILTTSKGVLNEFMERFMLLYPGWKLEGRRHGKLRIYNNPSKLWQAISTQ